MAQFPCNHFTHIIMDEVGQALEPEALIPLAGLATVAHGETFSCQVVMAGDPKQLGPILQSPIAAKFGLGRCLVFSFWIYSVEKENKQHSLKWRTNIFLLFFQISPC